MNYYYIMFFEKSINIKNYKEKKMKKIMAFGLATSMLLTPHFALADEPTNQESKQLPSFDILNQKDQKTIFKADEIKDEEVILSKATKLTPEEIKKEGISITSDDKNDKLDLDVYRYNQKLHEVQNPDGSTISLNAQNTVTVIGDYRNTREDGVTDGTKSVSVNQTFYYYQYNQGGSSYVKAHAFYATFAKLDSQVSGFTNLTLYLKEGGNHYEGSGLVPDRKVADAKVSPTFGTTYKTFEPTGAPFHYINISDNIGVSAGYFQATFKRGTGTWTFKDGILKGSGSIG